MGEIPNATWVEGCRNFTDEQFARAVRKLRDSDDDWPPTLPTFKRWARGGMSRDEARAYAQRKADDEVQAAIGRYNPHSAGMTYQEADRMRTRLERKYFAEAAGMDESEVLGLEHSSAANALEDHRTIQ